ncbi:MAG: transcription-repair coupling factor, partial [Clostridia bacterium]|nr:transcription-repair coupling factor [Clostridia bacterium]
GRKPRLHKLGGSEWTKVKARVKASVQEVARELLNLYAARETIKGHSFPQDTPWQREFEASFPYKETKDQLQAIEEAKKDMENQRPMDRLLVGDVGYGKTEVALRAAFKAIMDNKQVAVLVPTTILASQHYQTFKGRFDGFPVKIKVLNRLVKTKDQKETIQGLKSGSVDIVIGTHRLLSGDIAFKDLGLLVVDEEQRFGVTHKEKLKRLRQDVDVLTLTATPIPRTLHMALAGARDMSVIDTPPENRYPVQTYVLEHSRELVIEALRRELNRGGQVYYVHNRVNGLERRARDLNDLVPEARVAVGHGQMPAGELEKVMMDFTAGEIDVLVCTTIVENGLDIPNVNTLIVEEAHKFGLSQLYQLRGRVGRTNRIAYAYFTYGRDRILNPTAEKRLNAIVEFTEFGSGFKLAMRDLEIRGAGNLLGQEQHGHMLAVGFDLYCKLLENAVSQLKGEEKEVERKEEIDIDLRVSAYIGDEYIQEPTLKFEIYHRLGGVETMDQLEDLAEELRDRFGKPSQGMKNLLDLTELKILARGLNIKSFKENNGEIKIKFREGAPVNGEAFVILAEAYPRKLSFSSVDGLEITVSKRGAAKDGQIKLLTEILNILLEQSNKK